ncbi:glucose-6-phosphate dehydrogenase assembly protein OpcA [Pseudarthrobacter sp. N5]|uniref:glucose-6-phosphate dehydrogenase assembly protein OpcA n=1 Tax=Pseudarthrobacter sp. N5 TaxID=3418416 RepID=UPI003CFB29D7
MIVELRTTTTEQIAKTIRRHRAHNGVGALSRALTLIVLTRDGLEQEAIAAASVAGWKYPCRIIAFVAGPAAAPDNLDAHITPGGECGASEIIVLRAAGELAHQAESLVVPFLLPDSPIVAWWPQGCEPPMATTPIGRIAQRRISDCAALASPGTALEQLRNGYTAGDSDFAWTRITFWRNQLAAAINGLSGTPILDVTVNTGEGAPGGILLAAWLRWAFHVPVTLINSQYGSQVGSVQIRTADGDIEFRRRSDGKTTLRRDGYADQQLVIPVRSLADCLAEELRLLQPDHVFGEVVCSGLLMNTGSVEGDVLLLESTFNLVPTG